MSNCGNSYYGNDYYNHKPCCPESVNNNNNNNIVVPPVVIKDCPDKKDDHCKCKLKDFAYDVSPSQKYDSTYTPISHDESQPTEIAKVTLTRIKAGDLVELTGIFHVENTENSRISAHVRIYANNIVPGEEIYDAIVDIEDAVYDGRTHVNVQDVEAFAFDVGTVTYILTVFIENGETAANLRSPITFTGSLIRN
jgi:hypothetical protein